MARSSRSKRRRGASWVVPWSRDVGHRHPRGHVRLERGERGEDLLGEAIALDEFDAGLGLAFGAGPIGRARARLHVPITTEASCTKSTSSIMALRQT